MILCQSLLVCGGWNWFSCKDGKIFQGRIEEQNILVLMIILWYEEVFRWWWWSKFCPLVSVVANYQLLNFCLLLSGVINRWFVSDIKVDNEGSLLTAHAVMLNKYFKVKTLKFLCKSGRLLSNDRFFSID